MLFYVFDDISKYMLCRNSKNMENLSKIPQIFENEFICHTKLKTSFFTAFWRFSDPHTSKSSWKSRFGEISDFLKESLRKRKSRSEKSQKILKNKLQNGRRLHVTDTLSSSWLQFEALTRRLSGSNMRHRHTPLD